LCKIEGGDFITLLIVLTEQNMRKLEALKVGEVQREKKQKHFFVS
jgi:hypothetical protein